MTRLSVLCDLYNLQTRVLISADKNRALKSRLSLSERLYLRFGVPSEFNSAANTQQLQRGALAQVLMERCTVVTGPEYLKKRALQEVAEGSENTDIVIHEPLLAEDEPLPTPPESPLVNELASLMPDSSSGRTPSPSPGIISKEHPKLLSPGSWNEDKTSKGAGSRGNSKPSSRSSSRPSTPLTSAPTSAGPEGGGASSSRGPSRTPSQHSQSSKMEPGSDLEIKPLQKFDSEAKAPDVTPAAAAAPRNSLITPDEEEEEEKELRPAPKVTPKAPEPKPTTVKADHAPNVHERDTLVPQNKVESREGSRPSSKAEAKSFPRRQPSPAPPPKPAPPKPAPKPEPKAAPKPAEAKAVVAKPAPKAEPKAEPKLKVLISSPSSETSADLEDLEVRRRTHALMHDVNSGITLPLVFHSASTKVTQRN